MQEIAEEEDGRTWSSDPMDGVSASHTTMKRALPQTYPSNLPAWAQESALLHLVFHQEPEGPSAQEPEAQFLDATTRTASVKGEWKLEETLNLDLCLCLAPGETGKRWNLLQRPGRKQGSMLPLKPVWGQQLQGRSSSKPGQGWAGLSCLSEEPGFWPIPVCWSHN